MNYASILRQAFDLLLGAETLAYTQKDIVDKLEAVGIIISTSTLTNVKKYVNGESGSKNVGEKTLVKVVNGLKEVIYLESGKVFKVEKNCFEFDPSEDWSPVVVKKANTKQTPLTNRSTILFHGDGRRDIGDKIELMQIAEKEIIEIGVRMHTFANYFHTRRESEYKDYILELLERGVDFSCYVLNPKGRMAFAYFQDRAHIQPREMEAFEAMPQIIENLQQVVLEINQYNFKGKMRLFHYNSFPYYNALIADGDFPHGRMFISPYLYGVSRANSPVIEAHKQKDSKLFNKYWRSVKALISQAKQISKE